MAMLGEVCLLKAGKFVSANDISPEYNKGLYPCFGGNGIRGYVADYTHDGEFPLIGRQGALCGNVNLASGKFHATEHAVVVQPKIEMNVHWLYYALNAMNLGQYATGAAQPGLAVSKLETLSIEIPNISEQNKISQTLYKVEQLVNFRKQQLAKLDELVKARFVEMFGDLVVGDKIQTSKKKIGEIASVTKLAGFEFTKYIQYKEHGDIIMLRGLNCKQGKLILDDVKWIDKETSDLLPRSKLYYGDILMTYAGTIGDVAMVDENDKYHLAPNVAKVSINNKKAYNPIFLMYLFLYSNDYIMRFASQVAQASINMEKIRNFEYYFPDVTFQNQFATFVERVDQQKQTVQQGLEKLELMKKALMQEYFG